MRSALSNGADINWHHPMDNHTPLHASADYNKTESIQWLLSKGAAIDPRDD
uniref:Uncharacterized protein n=1 Tax=Amphimedon queenslandica TaxID=400682 RepID=A0A1X7SJ12_AMPQE